MLTWDTGEDVTEHGAEMWLAGDRADDMVPPGPGDSGVPGGGDM